MKRSLTHARESALWSNPGREALALRLHEALANARVRLRDPSFDAVLGNEIIVGHWRRTEQGLTAWGKRFGPDEMERAIDYVEAI
jgi:hypothetical protein